MLCDVSENGGPPEPVRPSGILPMPDSLTVGGISTAVASVIAEEKDRDKRKLNLILHNVNEPIAEDGLVRKKEDIMNHDSGFIIGIADVFCKNPNRTHTKHPPTKNNPLVVLCNEYRSTSKYQVKRKKYEHL